MKKVILAIVFSITATSAMAWTNGNHGGYNHGGYNHGGYKYSGHNRGGSWVGPAVVGGVIAGAVVGSVLTRQYYTPEPVYIAPAPVYVNPPVVVQPPAPYGYHWQNMLNPSCNCYQNVLVPN